MTDYLFSQPAVLLMPLLLAACLYLTFSTLILLWLIGTSLRREVMETSFILKDLRSIILNSVEDEFSIPDSGEIGRRNNENMFDHWDVPVAESDRMSNPGCVTRPTDASSGVRG
ncbi:hypothetical protein JYP49_21610 [Nitratireductor aquimarinus]|uniref:hypothetical protein n=1 Tax=Nitratireductor TaxID=245876 RepID=UPI0019D35852|nr:MULTISPECIES: hypothetical protein [Nitratireductor]MBN7778861.1 hypothetical protein [Nitratireductor pacificus]MBN7783191.1 hypothetical protein [Nitratireductor pacificus]MBN7791995.1 hypothetical protein [Nitratireductor aquimarinus]MBY6101260.1 hypothetical protein [Nitratireductor aquimarinus]MCA1262613.1 hypothetical protein [Nitratireductor aquimarinus]